MGVFAAPLTPGLLVAAAVPIAWSEAVRAGPAFGRTPIAGRSAAAGRPSPGLAGGR